MDPVSPGPSKGTPSLLTLPALPHQTALTGIPRTTPVRVFDGGSAQHAGGMVIGMATRKVTITLDEARLDQIRSLVQAGTAASVSGFVQHAVAVALDDVAGWGATLAEALRATGGELSDTERAWADEVLGTGTKPAA